MPRAERTKPAGRSSGRAEGVTRRGDSYYVAIRLGGGKMFRGTFPSERAAVAARDKARDDAREGRLVVDARTSRVTVQMAGDGWLATKDGTRGWLSYRTAWRGVAKVLGHYRLNELRASHVTQWLSDAIAAGYSPNTVRERLYVIRQVLDFAVADDLVATNVARLVKVPRSLKPKVRKYAPKASDIVAMIDATLPRYRIMWTLLVGLGVRSAEARGLTWDQIDWDTGAVRIDQQLRKRLTPAAWGEQWHDGCYGFDSCKAGSARTVMASAAVLDAIREHVETYGLGAQGAIVTSRQGRIMTPQVWQSAVHKAAAACDVDGFKGHKLRHAYASWALEDGATLAQVAQDLGHSDVTTTMRFYVDAQEQTDAARSEGAMARLARKPRADRHLRAVNS